MMKRRILEYHQTIWKMSNGACITFPKVKWGVGLQEYTAIDAE